MLSKTLPRAQRPFSAAKAAPCRSKLSVRCSAAAEGSARRDVLLAGAAAALATVTQAGPAAAGLKEMPVSSLSTFQKAAQRKAFTDAALGALRPQFVAADAPALLALILHDAATYDPVTQTGGYDGSILLSSDELNRPENAYLKPAAEKVKAAKSAVDAALPAGSGPIGYADLLAMAAKVATQAAWAEVKMKRVVTESGGKIITEVYGTEWPIRLGRVDSSDGGAAGRIPADDAPVAEIVGFMKQLGAKPGAKDSPFSPKPPFWERPAFVMWTAASKDPAAAEARFVSEDPATFTPFKKDYDRSRNTLTRTEYEVDFINNFTKLTAVGTTFNNEQYLTPEQTLQLKF